MCQCFTCIRARLNGTKASIPCTAVAWGTHDPVFKVIKKSPSRLYDNSCIYNYIGASVDGANVSFGFTSNAYRLPGDRDKMERAIRSNKAHRVSYCFRSESLFLVDCSSLNDDDVGIPIGGEIVIVSEFQK